MCSLLGKESLPAERSPQPGRATGSTDTEQGGEKQQFHFTCLSTWIFLWLFEVFLWRNLTIAYFTHVS